MGWHKQGRDGDAALQAMAALQAPWFEFESNGLIVTVPSSEVQGYGVDFASSPVWVAEWLSNRQAHSTCPSEWQA
jgi:hypothetical protein